MLSFLQKGLFMSCHFFIILLGLIFPIIASDNLVNTFDWNKDGIPDQFIFFPTNDTSLPSDFIRFEIHLSGKGTFTFEDKDSSKYWSFDTVKDCSSPPIQFLNSYNLLGSKCAAIFNVKLRNANIPVFFVFGQQVGTIPGTLAILSLDKTGKPAYVFKGNANLIDILDINKDGSSEIVLAPEIAWCERYYKSYNYCDHTPFYVYNLKSNGELVLDTLLSGKYNSENYIGWVGFNEKKYFVWENPKTHMHVITYLEEAIAKYFK